MLPLALALAAAPFPAGQTYASPQPACTAALCDADRLRPFLRRLRGARTGGTPVRILQIGDSHTAGDQITGAWRTALQARYGTAGRGTLAPGVPYAGYLTRGVTAGQSPGWTIRGIFGPAYSSQSTTPLGVSGYSAVAASPGAWLSLRADDASQAFDWFTVCGWATPGGGSVRLSAGAATLDWSLAAVVPGPVCRSLETSTPVTSATVTVTAGPVTLTSWTAEREGGGVTLSNLGVVGAQLVHFARTDDRVVAAELAVAQPDLIVVAFGTNEAFKPGFSASDYDTALAAGIRRLQRLAPGVPILMLGAPDSATSQPALRRGEGGEVSACPGSDWAPTAALARVQAIQRARAHELGVAYWDWRAGMGGACVADGWARAVPPRMRGDRVHFTRPGADIVAGLLQQDLDAAAAAMPAIDGTIR